MRKIVLFIALVVSIAASAESIDKILKPFYKTEGAVCTNVLKDPQALVELKEQGDDIKEIYKSVTKFETVLAPGTVEELRALADKMVDKAKMEQIYNLEDLKEQEQDDPEKMEFVEGITELFDYISAYARKKGDYYTDMVYFIHVKMANMSMVANVKCRVTEEQMKHLLPKVTID